MIVIKVLGFIIEFFIWFFILLGIFMAARDKKYQKLWREKKRTLVSMNPGISRAELCEQYVSFCNLNNCKVDF